MTHLQDERHRRLADQCRATMDGEYTHYSFRGDDTRKRRSDDGVRALISALQSQIDSRHRRARWFLFWLAVGAISVLFGFGVRQWNHAPVNDAQRAVERVSQ